jgi:hypothetical protein
MPLTLKGFPKMNPAVKAKWVAALRSGDYKKGTGKLRDERDCFCALGVLCNIHAQEHPEIAAQQKSKTSYMGGAYSINDHIRKWAGISARHPVVSRIINMNDGYSMSFRKIANEIEAHL